MMRVGEGARVAGGGKWTVPDNRSSWTQVVIIGFVLNGLELKRKGTWKVERSGIVWGFFLSINF
jgi:hypothetical protein